PLRRNRAWESAAREEGRRRAGLAAGQRRPERGGARSGRGPSSARAYSHIMPFALNRRSNSLTPLNTGTGAGSPAFGVRFISRRLQFLNVKSALPQRVCALLAPR